jgi:hypothetical protein
VRVKRLTRAQKLALLAGAPLEGAEPVAAPLEGAEPVATVPPGAEPAG